MKTSKWACNQIAFYTDNNSPSASGQHPGLLALVETANTPSTVYLYGLPEQEKALATIIGLHGVTAESPVHDRSTGQALGSVKKVCEQFYRDLTGMTINEVQKVLYAHADDKGNVELPVWMAQQIIDMPNLPTYLIDWAWQTVIAAVGEQEAERPLQYG